MRLVNLIPLKEIDFRNQDQFDDYVKQHSLRPDTKVTIAGKVTTAGQASKNSEPVKGTSVFGKDKGGSVFGDTPSKVNHPTEALPKEIYAKMDTEDSDSGEFNYVSTSDGSIKYGIADEGGKYYVTLGTEEGEILKSFGKTKDAGEAAQIFMKNLDAVKSKYKLDV
jgi:hypothetical protein